MAELVPRRLYGCLLPCRALKTRGNTPKYGLIFHSTFIGRAAAKNKGRISRYLANKCTIASRIDCFSGGPQKLPERPTPPPSPLSQGARNGLVLP